MPYYRVEGEIRDYTEDFIEAKSEKEAIEKARSLHSFWLRGIIINKISKEEYEDNIR